jgi:hypothetical protein
MHSECPAPSEAAPKRRQLEIADIGEGRTKLTDSAFKLILLELSWAIVGKQTARLHRGLKHNGTGTDQETKSSMRQIPERKIAQWQGNDPPVGE